MGVWKKTDDKIPKCLIEKSVVQFNIVNVRAFPSVRKSPQNIPGQYTNNKGLRYYPTLWILADIEFVNFKFATRYPPHISLSCIAVQLNVNKVEKLEKEMDQMEESHDSGEECKEDK